MKTIEKTSRNEASSIQIGFVLNTGILTTFIAVVLVILSGGFGDDISTQEELRLTADPVQANIVEADALTWTSDGFTAFFPPPSSDIDYSGEIDSSGTLTLSAEDGSEVTRALNATTTNAEIKTDGGETITFSQNDENIIVEYDSGELVLDVQRGASREAAGP